MIFSQKYLFAQLSMKKSNFNPIIANTEIYQLAIYTFLYIYKKQSSELSRLHKSLSYQIYRAMCILHF